MSTQDTPQQLPLTFRGISPLDGIRVRWAGSALVILGFGLCFFGGIAGVIFGVLSIALGIAVWALTHFGHYNWYDLPPVSRRVVGVGAVTGYVIVAVYLYGMILITKIIRRFA
ncbi:hypothetical protein [Terrabacter sp. BE26]|uniref:hypothetical protein n=1 Tax=Terrabacter sp. BE26 TaxID=2898152 RepID=UPI0035BE8E3A